MKTLSTDWLTEGLLDVEYKKYVVMAYLQNVQRQFGERKLYPDLPELQGHYRRSLVFRGQQGRLRDQFRKHLTGLDPTTHQLRYEAQQQDDACSTTLEAILDFALPLFERTADEGRLLDAEVAANLTVSPVGLLPLVRSEGYLLVSQPSSRETRVYQYRLTFFDDTQPPRRQMYTTPVETVWRGLTTTYEHLKLDLLRRHRHLPNPATFAVETRQNYPFEETLLPVAKRKVADLLEE
ncbi:MAG: hypothetical protein LH606_07940 [Cytophagaceae bacterium]|nr:hypothetical protein [Cytophagaceae bacterium]